MGGAHETDEKTTPPPMSPHVGEVCLLIKAVEPQGHAVRSQTKDMWHDPQLSPGPLSTFELLYCRAIVIGQQLSDVCATGLTLARKLQRSQDMWSTAHLQAGPIKRSDPRRKQPAGEGGGIIS